MSSFLEPTPRQGGNHISTPSIDWLDEHLGFLFGGHDSQIAVTPGTGAEHNSYRRMSSIICSIRLEYQTIPSPSGSSWRDGKILLIVAEKTPRKNVTGVASLLNVFISVPSSCLGSISMTAMSIGTFG